MLAATLLAHVQAARATGSRLSPGELSVDGPLLIDAENLSVSVPAGYGLEQLQKELRTQGLFYPPAFDLLASGKVGAHLASATCGPWRVSRGTTRDWVLGLEAVTGAGELVRTGSGVVKNVAGLDLTKLLIGSRGRLAIITGAFLRLAPLPEARAVIAADFAGPVGALGALPRLMSSALNPGAVELDGARLLVGLEGTKADLTRRSVAAREVLSAVGGRTIESSSLALSAPAGTSAVLARAGLPVSMAERWVAALPTGTPILGHAGNGLFWVELPADIELLERLRSLAVELRGYLEVEQGPASLKRSTISPAVAAMEARLVQLFDPAGIFDKEASHVTPR
jgi:FAD/FMN-containing dehydrogenase